MINKKATSILCYCSLIGWLVAYLAGDKDNAKLDINQGLVLSLAEVGIGIIGAIFGLIPVFIMKISDYGHCQRCTGAGKRTSDNWQH